MTVFGSTLFVPMNAYTITGRYQKEIAVYDWHSMTIVEVLASEGRPGVGTYRLSFDPRASFAYESENPGAGEDAVRIIGPREIPSQRMNIPPRVEPDHFLDLDELSPWRDHQGHSDE